MFVASGTAPTLGSSVVRTRQMNPLHTCQPSNAPAALPFTLLTSNVCLCWGIAVVPVQHVVDSARSTLDRTFSRWRRRRLWLLLYLLLRLRNGLLSLL